MNKSLIIGRPYRIKDARRNGFIGIGILKGVNPPEYPDGQYLFTLIDDPDGVQDGVFPRECIHEIAQHQDNGTNQFNDLIEIAVQSSMYDVVDWIKSKMKGN